MNSNQDNLVAIVGSVLASVPEIMVGWVFGSQVAKSVRPDSDLDVAVKYLTALDANQREATRREIIVRLTDALGALGERTDVVDLDRANVAVGFQAIRNGVLAFARSKADRVEIEARIGRRYDDEAPKRALFRKAALKAASKLAKETHDQS